MITDQKIEHQQVSGYTRFNYVIMQTRGFAHVFDMMRYDLLFFARKKDLERIISAANFQFVDTSYLELRILFAKYDWSKEPRITPARLLSNQQYEMVFGSDLWNHNADFMEFRPNKPLKYRSVMEFTGTVPQIIQIMYDNKAFPADENSAHKIESQFSCEEKEEITVNLANLQNAQSLWKI